MGGKPSRGIIWTGVPWDHRCLERRTTSSGPLLAGRTCPLAKQPLQSLLQTRCASTCWTVFLSGLSRSNLRRRQTSGCDGLLRTASFTKVPRASSATHPYRKSATSAFGKVNRCPLSGSEPTLQIDPLQISEGDAHIAAMSWLLSALAVSPFVLAFLAYWRGLHTAARFLPKERLKHGDYRVVPDLYSPEWSHRWLGIIVGEKTDNYSPRLKRALTMARLAFVLLPVALLASMALLGDVWIGPNDDPGSGMPAVNIPIEQ